MPDPECGKDDDDVEKGRGRRGKSPARRKSPARSKSPANAKTPAQGKSPARRKSPAKGNGAGQTVQVFRELLHELGREPAQLSSPSNNATASVLAKGVQMRYTKTGELVTVVGVHLDPPEPPYYTIAFSDDREKQTTADNLSGIATEEMLAEKDKTPIRRKSPPRSKTPVRDATAKKKLLEKMYRHLG